METTPKAGAKDSNLAMLDELRAELAADPRFDGEAGDVRVIETHISWVLVARQAYKIKKPVTLPFLDFASLEQRAAACRTEVNINRRLAPRVYLGVVPIRRTASGTFTFAAGEGPVVEWAVRMTRLSDESRADELLWRGELSTEQVDALAVGLAAFHADAEAGPEVARAGEVDAIARNVEDNFTALKTTAPGVLGGREAEALQVWQRSFLREHRDVFARRVAAGAIRDGHGDLRLEHVFFGAENDFEVIDGIEFDARYRHGDVCADVAFLAMDLARWGRVDLAERFVAAYARASNDYELYRLVDFYESYRAHVRAKVAAVVLADASATAEARERASAEVRRYLVLAMSAGRRSLLEPLLVVVAGGIASGKSTLARRLGDALSAPVVDADRTRKWMLGMAPTEHADSDAWAGPYDPRFSERVYAEVLARADAVLASGRPVILDATFRTAKARADARALAAARGVPFRLLQCDAPVDVCRERVAKRDRETSVSDGRVAIFDAFRAGYQPITEIAEPELVRIDTGGTPESALAQVEEALATWPARLVG